ncbi:hypothetical protein CFBP6625_07765 [Agrobacterium tumefaciens]|nr:hypothetical protein CFBP6625_07765 [Agrobacterium tumefaciens]
MSEMIERVARALWSKAKEEPIRRSVVVSFENAPLKLWWIDQARAAINAMREPTKAQLEAAEDIVVGYDDFACGDGNIYLGIPGYPQKARDVWAALVDAALKETA